MGECIVVAQRFPWTWRDREKEITMNLAMNERTVGFRDVDRATESAQPLARTVGVTACRRDGSPCTGAL